MATSDENSNTSTKKQHSSRDTPGCKNAASQNIPVKRICVLAGCVFATALLAGYSVVSGCSFRRSLRLRNIPFSSRVNGRGARWLLPQSES
jgi:hypothetical protein